MIIFVKDIRYQLSFLIAKNINFAINTTKPFFLFLNSEKKKKFYTCIMTQDTIYLKGFCSLVRLAEIKNNNNKITFSLQKFCM